MFPFLEKLQQQQQQTFSPIIYAASGHVTHHVTAASNNTQRHMTKTLHIISTFLLLQKKHSILLQVQIPPHTNTVIFTLYIIWNIDLLILAE